MAAAALPIENTATDPVAYVLQLGCGTLVVSALRAAVQADVPDQLAAGPKTAAQLAAHARVNEDALYRCLRALSSTGVFTELADRHFANNDASSALRADHPSRAREFILWMSNAFHHRAYSEFAHSVATAQTCVEKATGISVFDYFPTDPDTNREFNDCMTGISAMVVPEVLATYDFSGLGTLCDVAGGHGYVLTSILAKHADLNGILFDLDHVVAGAQPRIAAMGLTDRCRTVSGDFFQSVPAADSYVMKHIIHDWDDDKAITILKNCVRAMRGNGKVILLEAVLPAPNVPHLSKWIDIEMLAMPGGRERSEPEYRDLLARAGLRLTRILPNHSPLAVIESVKA